MPAQSSGKPARSSYVAIFVLTLVLVIIEISYTRIIAYKLFYYFTYLIIGFVLLGIGAGGVLVSIVPIFQRVSLNRLLTAGCLVGSVAIGLGYFIVALTPVNSFGVLSSYAVPYGLIALCGGLFVSFLSIGVMIAAILSRNPGSISRLYFADLIGAGAACALIIPLMNSISPPALVFLAGALLAVLGACLAFKEQKLMMMGSSLIALMLLAAVLYPRVLPDPIAEPFKAANPVSTQPHHVLFSKWNPIYRVDVVKTADPEDAVRFIYHDGMLSSALYRFDGNLSSLTRYRQDPRSYPFETPDNRPKRVLIIGAAGGQEILASLYFGATDIVAVELNPVTVSLTREVYEEYTGHISRDPRVTLVNAEGRSFLSRSKDLYDVIFFVAPDSFTSMNAATAGAFVLSESYLYTVETIKESLKRLAPGGIICTMFGEFSYASKPNRTARYAATVREAFSSAGIDDFEKHILVATSPDIMNLSTVLLKKEAFTTEEVERFVVNTERVSGSQVRHAWGGEFDSGPVNEVISMPSANLDAWFQGYPYEVTPVRDDAPFFWHFAPFSSVLPGSQPGSQELDVVDSFGERALLLMLSVCALFAFLFLILPFVAMRATWGRLPRKLPVGVYFSAIGLGFMFYEIALIQKLTLFLGYPTLSLTVTLMSLLVFTGLGSLLSGRYMPLKDRALPVLFAALLLLTIFWRAGFGYVAEFFLTNPTYVRCLVTVFLLAPLGLILGAYLPLGIASVSRLSSHRTEYVAWSWAVNGFFSVMGSVLATILSMSFGFGVVLFVALALYAVASLTLNAWGQAQQVD